MFFFLLVLAFGSCQEIDRTPKPKDLISEPKMVDVLTEVSLLQGARSYNKPLMDEKGIEPYNYIWEKFSIDSLQFVKSNNYYSENYKQYKRIYDSVRSRLEHLKVEYDTLRMRNERKQDSLSAIAKKDTLEIKRLRDSLIPARRERRILPNPVSRRNDTIPGLDSIR